MGIDGSTGTELVIERAARDCGLEFERAFVRCIANTAVTGDMYGDEGVGGQVTATVEIHDEVTAIPDWDELMGKTGAPVFYSSAYLSAYRKAEMSPAGAYAYLLLRDADGSARAALPAVLLPEMDPVGSLAVYEPAIAEHPLGLISHAWHCYDTWLPTRGGQTDLEGVAAILDGFRELAADFAAPWYGLVNVDATGPLAAALDGVGAHGVPIDERYVLDLPPGFSVNDYLYELSSRYRYTMRNHQRRAARAGATIRVLRPEEADLDAHLDLVRKTGEKHGVADFYPRGGFQEFQLRVGDAVRIIEIRIAGRIIGVGVCMVDAGRLHFWTCGVDYRSGDFSPFYVLFYEALRYATELGVPRFECGRRNGEFKRRYGLRPIPLLAYVSPTRRPLGVRA